MSSTEEKKASLLEYFNKSGDSMSKCIRDSKIISRSGYNKWMKNDPEFKAKVDAGKERDGFFLDMAEDKLLENLRKGNQRAIEYVLDRKGKIRGWNKEDEKNINITHRAIAAVEVPGITEDIFAQIGKNAQSSLPKDEADLRRLAVDRFGSEFVEECIDAKPE